MSVYSMVFSPAGGTGKVMDIVTEQWEDVEVIDLCVQGEDYSRYSFTEADLCFVGVPSYGGRVPETALKRIRSMEAGGAAAVIVAVYGNRDYDDTLLELKNELESLGFKVRSAIAAVAEHSIMHQYGSGRPDNEDREELSAYAGKIKESLLSDKEELKVPGNVPYREYKGVPFKPEAGNKCTKCGVCSLKCPVGAIPADDPGTVDKEKCISCMRCLGVCPVKARSISKVVLFAASQKLKSACAARKKNDLFLP